MTSHREQRLLPYPRALVFDLVADVEKYPEFLPWCQGCTITKRSGPNLFTADLIIGYGPLREKFTSTVTLIRPEMITVQYIAGPLSHLSNQWQFTAHKNGTTTVDFHVDFDFKSRMLQAVMGVFFNEIVTRMVGAFEARAGALARNKRH